ncbi:hypothetical protein M3J09_001743 [Ascochyta lentis]
MSSSTHPHDLLEGGGHHGMGLLTLLHGLCVLLVCTHCRQPRMI